jgi:uncharacterized protein YcgI (DUF1989 family)
VKVLREDVVPANSGWAQPVATGQVLRLTAMTIIDFVAFNADDLGERFDQARTRVYNLNIYLTAGHKVFSRHNNHMMTMIADGFEGLGTHDLQFGMCGSRRHKRAREEGRLGEYLHGSDIEVPDHGCAENLTAALEPYGVPYEDIPSPLNLFQNMDIDQRTGIMQRTQVRPLRPVAVDFLAEMDLIVAASACPDLASPGGGREITATILEP